MKYYSPYISLNKNSRGIYDLDITKGCFSGLKRNSKGCYGNCYAARYSKQYGYDFSKTIIREFENLKHLELIRDQVNNIDMPFIRIGVSGDPSENWKHLISVIKLLYGCNKKIVIITKHWKILTLKQLNELSKLDVCINTSVSALDEPILLKIRLDQYNRLKNYCKSVLRIVSCEFNINNLTGIYLNDLQNELLLNENIIDNILRVSKNNIYIKSGIIKIEEIKFLKGKSIVSMKNKNTFIGYCKDCPEMCGINYFKINEKHCN